MISLQIICDLTNGDWVTMLCSKMQRSISQMVGRILVNHIVKWFADKLVCPPIAGECTFPWLPSLVAFCSKDQKRSQYHISNCWTPSCTIAVSLCQKNVCTAIPSLQYPLLQHSWSLLWSQKGRQLPFWQIYKTLQLLNNYVLKERNKKNTAQCRIGN